MRFLILNTDYPEFIADYYSKNRHLAGMPFEKQLKHYYDALFGLSNFYSLNLKKLGHEALDISLNNPFLQKQWAREHNLKISKIKNFFIDDVIRKIPKIRAFFRPIWINDILEAQIKYYKPDILYIMCMGNFSSNFLLYLKKKYKLFIVGQHAAPWIKIMMDLSGYDLLLSSLPNFVDRFRKQNKNAEYFKLGFEHTILSKFPKQQRIYNCSFIGSISKNHQKSFHLLTEAAKRVAIDFWGPGRGRLKSNSFIYNHHHGAVWGRDMYNIMMQSKISINRHIDIAENYANNMRLYESTGCGALLITDKKDNLGELFEIDKEIVAYQNADDLVDKIKYYLEHEEERKKIAQAGQQRTLREHTYENRMKELISIINKYIK